MIDLVDSLATGIAIAWSYTGLFLSMTRIVGRQPPGWARGLFHELRPLYLPAVVVGVIAAAWRGEATTWMNLLTTVCSILNWFFFKDKGGDDDRWKRRKAKLAEKVTRSGSRLVVSPAGAK